MRQSLIHLNAARAFTLIGVGLLTLLATTARADNAGLDFFESKIRPVLVDHCYACHSSVSEKLKANLLLDTKDGMLKGGESGKPSIIPGAPERSLLIEAIGYGNDDLQMPPKKKLSASQISDFTAWVKMGAPDPRTNKIALKQAAPATNHWAFVQPKRSQPPEVQTKSWIKTPVDNFILQQLEKAGLNPAPEADRKTLIRRATFDLHGLPPTPEEVSDFVNDSSSDAYAKVVDRLLKSPRYGERWGRHWLDVARYADTKGYVYGDREDARFLYSYPYRDWVIKAFNDDMPYDRFLKLQVAADQLDAAPEDLAAMGYLTLGRRFLGVTHDIIDDRIDVLTRGMQGLTVACARCHDHKFDPIPTKDYYSLYGIFEASTEKFVPAQTATTNKTKAQVEFESELKKRTDKFESTYAQAREDVANKIRRKIKDYFVAQLTVKDLPNEEFYEILDADQTNPIYVRAWETYLREKKKSFDPIFAPWHMFADLPQGSFEAEAPAAWSKLKAEKGSSLNKAVVERIEQSPPKSMKEVVELYGALFEQVVKDWSPAAANAPPATETSIAEDEWPRTNSRFIDPDVEALRLVLYAKNSPVYPPAGALVDTQFYFDESTRLNLGKLFKEIEVWHLSAEGATPYAGILEDRSMARLPKVFKRGNPGNKGDEVPRQFLELLSGADRKPFQKGSGRVEMAEAIASSNNPLTARVMVNRVWMHHFGAGLVKTASDFGTRCEAPSHPELLDYLAVKFMDEGWSIKKLHRLMMLSSVYQQQSVAPENTGSDKSPQAIDPENRWLWRMNRQRLDFEGLRDSILFVSGNLDPKLGGKPVKLFDKPYSSRRSVYGYVDRVALPGPLQAFDFANPDLHTPQRHQTTVPQQALFLMNNPFMLEQAEIFAARFKDLDEETRVTKMMTTALQREPVAQEIKGLISFVHALETKEPVPAREPVKPSQWTYGYGEVDKSSGKLKSFTHFPYYKKDAAWQGGEAWPDPGLGWLRLTPDGGHPGEGLGKVVIRRWTSPIDGSVKISGRIAHESAMGDGIHARIVHSAKGPIGGWNLHNQTIEAAIEPIEVKKGETLDFVVDCRDALSHDDFKWSPTIANLKRTSDKAGDQKQIDWVASRDFSGAQPEPPKPLDGWTALAQSLLLSNEFIFVD